MFTVVFSIPRWGSLCVMGVVVRTASAAGGVVPTAGVGAGLDPAGAVGFTASSRFHMGNLHLSEVVFDRSQGDFSLGAGQQVAPEYTALSCLSSPFIAET
jgi:hypothetical protein